MNKLVLATALALAGSIFTGAALTPVLCAPIEMDDVANEQAKEKLELEDMRHELKDIKGEVNGAMQGLGQLQHMLNDRIANPAKEYHLFAREAAVDIGGGVKIKTITYNGNIPGPQLDLREGQPVRIVLHNQLKVPTSLHFHGLIVPHNVDGLPRSKSSAPPSVPGTFRGGPGTAGGAVTVSLPERMVKPGESYGFQFVPQGQGTYFYHPQIVHMEERTRGLYGAIIVHPRTGKQADVDQVLMIGELKNESEAAKDPNARPIYIVNGKTAPYIPPIEVRAGERVRLRLINVCEETVPLHLSGHKMEVVSNNGSDLLEPRVFRDTIALNPGERMDVEFTAGNVGVWSLASEKVSQTTSNGKFPAGIALVVRYQEMKGQQATPQ
ncbi:MAG: multicopper oxidase family protein [Cyanobacteria bacterium SZAS LIN-2]|nr:multicopper oxidase family protein [Cyanobacteria bacterium SZAS LIN-3]MBS1995304.1 multicopper oxidase family protein [Cyanobacteria bacterium SZAS LIN-2]